LTVRQDPHRLSQTPARAWVSPGRKLAGFFGRGAMRFVAAFPALLSLLAVALDKSDGDLVEKEE
jgi:hypothetical protein